MSDPRVMPEMIKAGIDAYYELDRDHDSAADIVEHIYRAMEDARPPGYTSKVLAAMKAKFEAELNAV